MKKNIVALLFIVVANLFAQERPTAEGVEGYWVMKKEDKPVAILGAYVYEDRLYVKLLVSFDPQDSSRYVTTDNPIKAEALKGSPSMQGLDIVWGGLKSNSVKKGESRWIKARVLDPAQAKLFGGEIYKENGVLVLKGNYLSFPLLKKTVIWHPLEENYIPKGYTLPRLDTLRPVLCEEYLNM